jgi:multiple sugar transport system permease protein
MGEGGDLMEERIRIALIVLGSAFMLLFCLLPFLYMGVTSLSASPDYLSPGGEYRFTLGNYVSLLTTPSLHFIDYLRNSLIVSFLSAFFTVMVASLAAYSITRLPLPGKMFILFFVLAVSMFPQISLLSYLFRLMTRLHWINTYQGLVLPYIAWTLPLSLWILVSYFSQLPGELDRAALIDGCTRWQILRKIIFPVAAPGLVSTGLLAFIFAFNEFMFALMLTTNHHARTIPVGIALFQGLHGEIPWGNIMAASVLTTIPVVILTVVFQRRMIQGLTRGAVKG